MSLNERKSSGRIKPTTKQNSFSWYSLQKCLFLSLLLSSDTENNTTVIGLIENKHNKYVHFVMLTGVTTQTHSLNGEQKSNMCSNSIYEYVKKEAK